MFFSSDRNAEMVTPAQTPGSRGSVSSPPAMARGGCLRRSKNKVCMEWCFLQPIQDIHELDKVSQFTAIFGWFLWTFPGSPWTYVNFWQCTTSWGKEICRCAACCQRTMCLCFVLCVAPFCGFALHLLVVLAERGKHQFMETLLMPGLMWQTIGQYSHT